MSLSKGVTPQAGSGHSPKGGAASASPAEPSVPNADDLPTVTHEGIAKLGDLEIKVLRLSNGESVIEAESFHKIMDALFSDPDGDGA